MSTTYKGEIAEEVYHDSFVWPIVFIQGEPYLFIQDYCKREGISRQRLYVIMKSGLFKKTINTRYARSIIVPSKYHLETYRDGRVYRKSVVEEPPPADDLLTGILKEKNKEYPLLIAKGQGYLSFSDYCKALGFSTSNLSQKLIYSKSVPESVLLHYYNSEFMPHDYKQPSKTFTRKKHAENSYATTI